MCVLSNGLYYYLYCITMINVFRPIPRVTRILDRRRQQFPRNASLVQYSTRCTVHDFPVNMYGLITKSSCRGLCVGKYAHLGRGRG
jgi:hypothetical protein